MSDVPVASSCPPSDHRGQVSRRGRAKVLVALGFGFFIDSAEDQALPMLFPALRSALNLGYKDLSFIDSVRIIFQTFSGPFWGMAADRYSRRWILVLGTGIWGIWTLGCGLVTGYGQLLALRVMACLGLGCLYPAAFSLVADFFGSGQRGKALGIIGAVGMLGIMAGALVFGELLKVTDTGWRWAFVLLGSASIVSGLVIALCIKDPIRGSGEPELQGLLSERDRETFRFHLRDLRELARCKTLWVNFLQGVFVLTPINAMALFFVTWLVDERGYSQAEAPVTFGAILIFLALGNMAGGLAGDWADRRWPLAGRIAVSQVSIACALPAMWFLLVRAETRPAILISASWAAFFLDWTRRGSKQPLVQNVTRPELRGTAMALTEFVQGSVASLLIILFGHFSDRWGLTATLIALVFGFWAVALGVTSGYYLVYPRDMRRLRRAMAERAEQLSRIRPGVSA